MNTKSRKEVRAFLLNMKNKITKNNNDLFLRTISLIKEVSLSASMTLEAAIVLPVFIFFFVNIMSAIDVLRVQSELEAALHQVGSDCMQMAYDSKASSNALNLESEIVDIAEVSGFSVYAVAGVNKKLDGKISGNIVKDGIKGLKFTSSRIMTEGDIIDIVVDYKVRPVFAIAGFHQFPVQSRFYGHAFTGYDPEHGIASENEAEQIVYVTEHGTVYHSTVNCKYLSHTISSVAFSALGNKRNSSGGKYYSCEYCGKKVTGGDVFITPYGDRFHSRVDCPGLKRTIYTIPISEVGGRGPCSGCN